MAATQQATASSKGWLSSIMAHTGIDESQLKQITEDGYWLDWLGAICAIVFHVIVPINVIPPIERPFQRTDASLAYPHKVRTITADRVSFLLLRRILFSNACLPYTSFPLRSAAL